MGGFSGTVPEPTLAKAEELVHSGQLRFFLVSGGGSGAGFATGGGSTSTAIDSWVRSACTRVPAKDYGAAATTTPASAAAGLGGGTETLYACGRSA
jgi:hypothetical protein